MIAIEDRPHPVEIAHAILPPAAAVRRAAAREGGHLLVFLPGAGEIARLRGEIGDLAAGGRFDILPLHGSLGAEEQDAALAPSPRRKIVLATNLAETSLTIEGVTDVIDTGLARVPRFDPAKGIDRLEVERISRDCADQRAGRAGRTGPGRALRLWGAGEDRKSTRLNSSHIQKSRMPSSA